MSHLSWRRLVAVFVAPALSALGQTSPNTDSSSDEEDIVVLSPFTVSADDDDGYVATNTLAGSRLNTSLADTAASIDVLTAELLQDIAATSLEEAIEYATNSSNDFGVAMTSDNEQLEEPTGRINVRGLKATRTRNYLPVSFGGDTYNVDRVEENRGPNSILFGIGSASGIINLNTKKAVIGRTFQGASISTNTAGGYRGTVDLNQALGDRLAVRVNAVYSDLDDPVAFHAHREFEALHLAASLKVSKRIRLTAEFETGEENAVLPVLRTQTDGVSNWLYSSNPGYTFADWASPGASLGSIGASSLGNGNRGTWIDNNNTAVNFRSLHQTTGTGLPIYEQNFPELWDRRVNTAGPGQLRAAEFNSYGAALEFAISRSTQLELSYGHNDSDTSSTGFIMEGIKASPNAFYRDKVTPNPYVGDLYFEGQYRQFNRSVDFDSFRATLSHEMDFEKFGKYRVALMAERDNEDYFNSQRREVWVGADGLGLFNADPRNSQNRLYRRHYIEPGDVGNWESYVASSPAFDPVENVVFDSGQTGSAAFRNQSQETIYDNKYETALIGLQARYFENHLVLGLGYRHDELTQRHFDTWDTNNDTRERITKLDSYSDYEYTGKTKTGGVVYHINPNFRLMANYSDNFGLPASARKEYPDGGPGKATTGEGMDFGLGFTLLDGRLSGRFTRFETDSTGLYTGGLRITNYNNALSDALVLAGQITQAQADSMFIDGTGGTYDQHVEGYEFAVTANLTRNWRLSVRYAYTDGYSDNSFPDQVEWLTDPNGRLGGFGGLAFYENPAWANLPISDGSATTIAQYIADFKDELTTNLLRDGISLPKNQPHKANFTTRYTFSDGILKGLFVGGGMRYASKSDLGFGYDTNNDVVQLLGGSRINTDFMMGYTFKKFFGVDRMSIQVNVKNVFDDEDYIITRRNTDGTIRDLVYPQPRLIRFTANFRF